MSKLDQVRPRLDQENGSSPRPLDLDPLVVQGYGATKGQVEKLDLDQDLDQR